ncbi:MAG: regulatory protein RecX [Sphingomicrobium sp.]
MSARKPRRERPPLDQQALSDLALRYVGRFATTRSKLLTYLRRKLRERGWSGTSEPDLEAMVQRFVELGYIDDAGYALSKSRSLTGRGYGVTRVVQSLRIAGVEEEDGLEARAHAEQQAVSAALRFAERKRIGPFATASADPKARQRALATMVRAGHSFALSRAIVDLCPGIEPDRSALSHAAGCRGD